MGGKNQAYFAFCYVFYTFFTDFQAITEPLKLSPKLSYINKYLHLINKYNNIDLILHINTIKKNWTKKILNIF